MKILGTKHKVQSRCKRGFTLVEIIVALAIFSIVATVALGALLKIMTANKKAQAIHTSISNLNFALDSMTRELEQGSNFSCLDNNNISSLSSSGKSGTSGTGCTTIAFYSANTASNSGGTCNLIYAYRFMTMNGQLTLAKAQQIGCNDTLGSGGTALPFFQILSPDVNISNYHIAVSTDKYATALIYVSGYAGVNEQSKTYFDIQTAISSRFVPF